MGFSRRVNKEHRVLAVREEQRAIPLVSRGVVQAPGEDKVDDTWSRGWPGLDGEGLWCGGEMLGPAPAGAGSSSAARRPLLRSLENLTQARGRAARDACRVESWPAGKLCFSGRSPRSQEASCWEVSQLISLISEEQ